MPKVANSGKAMVNLKVIGKKIEPESEIEITAEELVLIQPFIEPFGLEVEEDLYEPEEDEDPDKGDSGDGTGSEDDKEPAGGDEGKDEGDDSDKPSETLIYNSLKDDLVIMCEKVGLDASGLKADLQERLLSHYGYSTD